MYIYKPEKKQVFIDTPQVNMLIVSPPLVDAGSQHRESTRIIANVNTIEQGLIINIILVSH